MAENRKITLQRLEEILDTFGSDSSRWPAGERRQLERLIETDARARRLLVETDAFDRLLALAPVGEASPALASRIVATAVADGSRDARIVPIGAVRTERQAGGKGFFSARTIVMAPAAALLAASFAFGLYLGVAIVDDTAFGSPFETASVDESGNELDSLFSMPENVDSPQEGLL